MPLPRNLPNLITGSRLVLAASLFTLLVLVDAGRSSPGAEWAQRIASSERLLLNVSLAIFALAALSDVLDGHIARRWGLQTDFGRIADPFADKVIVCGSFVLLTPFPAARVAPWMVVVILARELLVDGLRGFAESRGVAFPATFSGKAKMFTQCVCLLWILGALANAPDAPWAGTVTLVLLTLTIAATVASGADYVARAWRELGPAARAASSGGVA